MTDSARQLCTGEMKNSCEQESIKLHTLVRYSPESNGVAGRTTEYSPTRRVPCYMTPV